MATCERNSPADREITSVDGDNCRDEPASQDSADDDALPLWSSALRSPLDPAFSPSLKESHHGWALQATTDRSRNLLRCSRRAVSLLLDVTQTYDQLAQALLKAGQSLNPIIAAAPQTLEAVAVQESVVFWSGETSRLSSTLRTDIAVPLQNYLNMLVETVQSIHEKYQQSRLKSCTIRQRAIRARVRYVKVLQEAEQAAAEWKESLAPGSDESALPKTVANKVDDVKRRAAHYRGLVAWENECVDQCERMEEISLEALQKIEEDRIFNFLSSIMKAFKAEKLAMDEVSASMKQETKPSDPQTDAPTDEAKEGRTVLAKFRRSPFTGTIQYDEGCGIMDAETLGLPLEIGKLRETVRCRMAARSMRVQTLRALAVFLEYVCTALERFSAGMKQIVRQNESKNKGLESVLAEMKVHERSEPLIGLWEDLIRTLGFEADEAAACANKLRNVRVDKLDGVVLYGDRLLKAAAENEDSMWKQLCEAARSQSRMEENYRQTTAVQQKARDRVLSVDSVKSSDASRVGTQFSKSLANVFSVLPNGGEHAMKILGSETVASIAQHTLADADEKEVKGRLALDAAVQATTRFVEKYKSNAQTWISQFDKEDQNGWGDMRPVFESFSSLVQASRESSLTTLGSLDVESKTPLSSSSAVTRQWVSEMLKRIPASASSSSFDPSGLQTEYKLSVALETSARVERLLPKSEDGGSESTIDEELDAEDDQLVERDVDDGGIYTSSSGSRDEEEESLDIAKEPKDCPGDENQAANWLRLPLASNSMSDSFRGKLFRRKALRRYQRFQNVDTETEIFASYFWMERGDSQTTPSVIKSFSCCRMEEGKMVASRYGRVFLSDGRLVFVCWTGKKLSLRLVEEVTCLEPIPNLQNGVYDTLQVTFNKSPEKQSKVLFGGFYDLQTALDQIQNTLEEAKVKAEKLAQEKLAAQKANMDRQAAQASTVALDKVPPDSTLTKMEVVLSRHIRNISIQRFYEIAWSEGMNTKEKPLYEPYLEESCMEVSVGGWEFGDYMGEWDQEHYEQKRFIQFKVKRKTHLYMGPPIATVRQTQLCCVQGQDKCVVNTTVECEGIPYADTFAVEVRWVASREGSNDILVEVGVFVRFKKSTLFQSQIRSGTMEETKAVHEDLFDHIKKVCLEAGGEEVPEIEEQGQAEAAQEETVPGKVAFDPYKVLVWLVPILVVFVWRFIMTRANKVAVDVPPTEDIAYLGRRIDQLEEQIKVVQQTLDEVLVLLKSQR